MVVALRKGEIASWDEMGENVMKRMYAPEIDYY